MSFVIRLVMLATVSCAVAFTTAALAEDIEGGRDHPLVGRFDGSSIVYYDAADFDEAALLQAPHDYNALLERDATKDRSGPEWLALEGKVTKIRYEVPVGHSSLEVMRNYEAALAAGGFITRFSCKDAECLTGKLTDNYLLGEQIDSDNGVSTAYATHARYLLASLDRKPGDGAGSVYVSILVGEDGTATIAFVEIVETGAALDTNKISVVDARQMGDQLSAGQPVNIYGVTFDVDSAILQSGSRPTLDQIAKLLADRPELRLDVVGHTDSQGTADYNLDLSRRRAESVVADLVNKYGIAPERLTPSGQGFNRPVASNDTEEGRAMNRRVELISR